MANMKKITGLIIFVLMLAQVASASHAVTESFHADHTKISVAVTEDGANIVLDKSGDSSFSEHNENCQVNCHGHCHMFISGKPFDMAAVQDVMSFPFYNQLFNGLVRGPDSPPPNIL